MPSDLPVPLDAPRPLGARLRALRDRYAAWQGAVFFALGFVFDARMLRRIDEPAVLLQQGAYLLLCGALIALAQRGELTGWRPPRLLRAPWRHADELLHFMLGTLLNAYTLFYFRSASGLTALGFLIVVAGLLAVNELPRFRRLGPLVLYALYSVCLTSYFAYLLPVLLGRIRPWMFYLAVLASLSLVGLHLRWLRDWSGSLRYLIGQAAAPAIAVQAAFVLLYALRLTPPVPLAIEEMGIYHSVAREPGGWRLERLKGAGTLWQRWRPLFLERAGDRVYCFARVFAPSRFHDRIDMVWFFDDPGRGWTEFHRLPLGVSQTPRAGARGFATDGYLTHPRPGRWRVEIQSEDGRTLGLLHFTVAEDGGTGPRDFDESFDSTSRPT
ncbi:MAG: DUF2914 domain-containing protein [Myxococcales bacterium]